MNQSKSGRLTVLSLDQAVHSPRRQVSPQDIDAAMQHYSDNSAFQALTPREKEIVAFLDTTCPVRGGQEQTVDV